MGFAPKSIFLDNVSGYFSQAIFEALGDSNAALWGSSISWGPITGSWRRDVRALTDISDKRGIIVGVAAHLEPKVLTTTIGYDTKGKPIKDSTLVGWQISAVGKSANQIFVPFDEVYHLTAVGNDAGVNPNRKLFTCLHQWHDYDFEAKSRKGVQGPIVNPDYGKIISAVPKGRDTPRMFLLCGVPGVGKTTLFGSFPAPRLFIDIQGGCEEEAKKPETKVIKPEKLSQVFDILKQIRDKGELND